MLFEQIPYARFLQLARVAAREKAREQNEELRRTALIGYQFYLCQPVEKGHQHKSFSQWSRAFGVLEDGTPMLPPDRIENIRERAEANERKVIDMFKRKQAAAVP